MKIIKKFYMSTHERAIVTMMEEEGWVHTTDLEEAWVVIYAGGSDINPALYDASKHPSTSFFLNRDEADLHTFQLNRKGALNVGICRGAQFLNVMSGGTLYQDVDGHGRLGGHMIYYRRKDLLNNTFLDKIHVTSTHHQMMRPAAGAILWGWCSQSSYRDRDARDDKRLVRQGEGPDTEIVYYENTHSLCFQPHPEYRAGECRNTFFDCIERAFDMKDN